MSFRVLLYYNSQAEGKKRVSSHSGKAGDWRIPVSNKSWLLCVKFRLVLTIAKSLCRLHRDREGHPRRRRRNRHVSSLPRRLRSVVYLEHPDTPIGPRECDTMQKTSFQLQSM